MSDDRVIAAGRDAEIVDVGEGRVLRRPYRPRSLAVEADVMRHVRAAGFPVPAVYDVRPDGMVMERVSGPTMLEDLAAHPWRLGAYARLLARLHDELQHVPLLASAPATYGQAAAEDVTVHGDLHPDNVLLTATGPVVIDWSSAGRGPCGADAADTWLLLAAAAPPPGSIAERVLVSILRGRFVAAFLRAIDRDLARSRLALAVARRERDPNLHGTELDAMRRLAAEQGR